MDEVAKDVRGGGVKELLYADDLVLLGGSWENVEGRFAWWKRSMMEKGLKVNVKRTMVFRTGKRTVAIEAFEFPCTVCRRGVGRNSILSIKYNKCINNALE